MRERRKYDRYDTEAKVYFRVKYAIKTRVKFKILDKKSHLSRRYAALSKNVSAEGFSFTSNRRLRRGDIIYLEVYLPRQKKPVCMIGETRWSSLVLGRGRRNRRFNTGLRLLAVSDKPVPETIYYDKKNNVVWSVVLDSIFGSFSKIMQQYRHKK